MAINIIDGFYLGNSVPIDSRFVVADSIERIAIVYKYDGLKVFQRNTRETWVWNSDTSSWNLEGASSTSGSGTSNYVAQWITSTSLGNSIIYATYSTGRVGINDNNPLTTLSLKDYLGSSSPLSLNIRYINVSSDSAVVGYNWYYNSSDLVPNTSKSSTKIEIGNAGALQVQTRTAASPVIFNTVFELNNLSGYNFLRGLDKGTFISGSVSFGTGTTPVMSPQLVNVGGSFRTSSSFHSNRSVITQTTPTYTVVASDHELIFNASDIFTIILPTVDATNVGRVLEISNNGYQMSFSTSPLGLDNVNFSGVIDSKEKVKLIAILVGSSYRWKITEIITPSSTIYSTLASETWKLIGGAGTMDNGQLIPNFTSANSTNRGSGYQNLRLRKVNSKYVHLQGSLLLSNLSNLAPALGIITLPSGYRPTSNLEFPLIFRDTSSVCFKGILVIGFTGQVIAFTGTGEIGDGTVNWTVAIDAMIPID